MLEFGLTVEREPGAGVRNRQGRSIRVLRVCLVVIGFAANVLGYKFYGIWGGVASLLLLLALYWFDRRVLSRREQNVSVTE